MSVKKYRIYLLMVVLVVIIVGVFFYYSGQEKTYREGTLVQNEWISEEEFA